MEVLTQEDVNGSLSTPSSSTSRKSSTLSSTASGPTVKKPKISPNIAALDKVVNTLQNIAQRNTNMREEDEFDVYGKYIAHELRKLPPATTALLQDEINKLISQVKLQTLGVQIAYADE